MQLKSPTSPLFNADTVEDALATNGVPYRRRPWLVVLGVAMSLSCAAVVMTLFASSSHRVSVLVASRFIPAGTVMSPSDLAVVQVPSDQKIATLPVSDARLVIGKRAGTQLYEGQALVPQQFASQPVLLRGDQIVGLTLRADQLPMGGLVPGDTVQIFAVPNPQQATSIANGEGSSLVSQATVYSVGEVPISSSQYSAYISVIIPENDASVVESWAAADQIGLTLVSMKG